MKEILKTTFSLYALLYVIPVGVTFAMLFYGILYMDFYDTLLAIKNLWIKFFTGKFAGTQAIKWHIFTLSASFFIAIFSKFDN